MSKIHSCALYTVTHFNHILGYVQHFRDAGYCSRVAKLNQNMVVRFFHISIII
nr:MAG TPA: hypothetical protein [Inoviridae sp.]